jgi:hypothetical protein
VSDPFDPKNLKLDQALVEAPQMPKPGRPGRSMYVGPFISLPLRLGWLFRLNKITNPSVREMGLILWRLASVYKSMTFIASNWAVEPYGISARRRTTGLGSYRRQGSFLSSGRTA